MVLKDTGSTEGSVRPNDNAIQSPIFFWSKVVFFKCVFIVKLCFSEVRLIKLYIVKFTLFLVYSSMSFDHLQLCYHHHNQNTEHFYHLRKVPCASLSLTSSSASIPSQPLTCSVPIVMSFPEYPINVIIQHATFLSLASFI